MERGRLCGGLGECSDLSGCSCPLLLSPLGGMAVVGGVRNPGLCATRLKGEINQI